MYFRKKNSFLLDHDFSNVFLRFFCVKQLRVKNLQLTFPFESKDCLTYKDSVRLGMVPSSPTT